MGLKREAPGLGRKELQMEINENHPALRAPLRGRGIELHRGHVE